MVTFPATLDYPCPHCGGPLRFDKAPLLEALMAGGETRRYRVALYRCRKCRNDLVHIGDSDPPGWPPEGTARWSEVAGQ